MDLWRDFWEQVRSAPSLGRILAEHVDCRCFSGSYCSAYGYCSPEFCGVGCQSCTPLFFCAPSPSRGELLTRGLAAFGSCAGFTAPSCTATSATSTVLFTTASATKTVTLTVSSSSAVAIPTGTTSPKFVIYSCVFFAAHSVRLNLLTSWNAGISGSPTALLLLHRPSQASPSSRCPCESRFALFFLIF